MLVKRSLHKKIESYINSKEVIAVTGMRRTGKTTMLRMIYDEIKTENKIFLDLENPANQIYFSSENYDVIVDTLAILGLKKNKRMYVFLDEIQALKNISSVVKYLTDHYDIKFFLSGSASFYIKNLFTESLSGRKYIFELYPFSFNEFLQAKKVPILDAPQKTITEATYLHYTRYFNEYLLYGGFPGVVFENSHDEKIRKIEDIFSSYWSLEVEGLSDFKKKDKVRDFIFLLMQRTGSRLDITKLSKELGVAKDTLNNYLAFLQDTYLISTINPFSTNRDTEIRGAKKMYFVDSGLLNHFARISEGSTFENTCFNLLRTHGNVQYYQKKTGQEIDFIVNGKTAYEVKTSAGKHHISTLSRRIKSLKIDDYYIISKSFLDDPRVIYGFNL